MLLPGKLQRIHLRARRRSNRRGGRGLSRRHYHHRFNAGDAMHVEPALAPEPGQGDEPSVHGSAEDDAVRCHDAGQTALGSVRRGDGQCAQLIRAARSGERESALSIDFASCLPRWHDEEHRSGQFGAHSAACRSVPKSPVNGWFHPQQTKRTATTAVESTTGFTSDGNERRKRY